MPINRSQLRSRLRKIGGNAVRRRGILEMKKFLLIFLTALYLTGGGSIAGQQTSARTINRDAANWKTAKIEPADFTFDLPPELTTAGSSADTRKNNDVEWTTNGRT
jgi:hypothetical protein